MSDDVIYLGSGILLSFAMTIIVINANEFDGLISVAAMFLSGIFIGIALTPFKIKKQNKKTRR